MIVQEERRLVPQCGIMHSRHRLAKYTGKKRSFFFLFKEGSDFTSLHTASPFFATLDSLSKWRGEGREGEKNETMTKKAT